LHISRKGLRTAVTGRLLIRRTWSESVRISRTAERDEKRSISEEQTIGILKRQEARQKVADLAREHRISEATI
jgi:hypothetical protein